MGLMLLSHLGTFENATHSLSLYKFYSKQNLTNGSQITLIHSTLVIEVNNFLIDVACKCCKQLSAINVSALYSESITRQQLKDLCQTTATSG